MLTILSKVDKVVKKSVSMRESVLKLAENKAAKEHGGNVSGYIAGLIERDLSSEASTPNTISPTIKEHPF